jgi:KUP system potassium uptake protein
VHDADAHRAANAALDGGHGVARGVGIDPDTAFYFLSRITIQRGNNRALSPWRKRLFIGLAHNAASPADYFHLPEHRTVVMGFRVEL